jgi:hypothetical protein
VDLISAGGLLGMQVDEAGTVGGNVDPEHVPCCRRQTGVGCHERVTSVAAHHHVRANDGTDLLLDGQEDVRVSEAALWDRDVDDARDHR